MQAVILAAGLGTRMGELTKDTPKPLLKIGDKTLLEHDLEALPDEIDEVIIVIGYLGEEIKKLIGEKYQGKKITYVEQKELKGTAHALSLCKDFLKDHFLVFYGDDMYDREDLKALIKYPLAILVSELEDGSMLDEKKAGATVKTNEQGQLADILERQPAVKGTLINTGAYCLDMHFFDYPLVSAGVPASEFGLPQTFMQMVRDGAKMQVIKAKQWKKIVSPEDLKLDN